MLSTTGSLASTLGTVQPFRYRGYVYDVETALYYLASRFYSPDWFRFINADLYIISGKILSEVLSDTSDQKIEYNAFVYCKNNPLMFTDTSGENAATVVEGTIEFSAFVAWCQALVAGTWWNPIGWIIAGIIATGIITWAAIDLYQRYQREQEEIRRINEQNKNKTVEEILKTKKGSIKRAPLPPNGPNWDAILNMTLAEIQALAKKEPSKWHEIYKLLTDGRFNR